MPSPNDFLTRRRSWRRRAWIRITWTIWSTGDRSKRCPPSLSLRLVETLEAVSQLPASPLASSSWTLNQCHSSKIIPKNLSASSVKLPRTWWWMTSSSLPEITQNSQLNRKSPTMLSRSSSKALTNLPQTSSPQTKSPKKRRKQRQQRTPLLSITTTTNSNENLLFKMFHVIFSDDEEPQILSWRHRILGPL